MKAFIFKFINLGMIVAAIFSYQGYAKGRQSQVEAYEAREKAAKKEWAKLQSQQSKYKDGSYQGSAKGYGGIITTQVVISGGAIQQIEI
ncbi:MAG: hypothetical protein K6G62_04380, partial [Eubacterium sp.]|nr:hypothetical protein [Eubacterium sp.]